jgi:TonB-linked SusC/RagA family outer membrane protein
MKKRIKILIRRKSSRRSVLTLSLWVLFFSTASLSAQTITGSVVDESGNPLTRATVVESTTNNGVLTDAEGKFSIELTGVSNQLTVSYVGYQTMTVEAESGSPMSIVLYEGVGLDEVVVSALGISREKKSLGYSVTEVGGGDLSRVKESNVASNLAGRVAGVVVYKNTSGVGGAARVIIRGNNSLSGNNEPLYVVDGVPIDNSNLAGSDRNEFRVPDYGNGISDINADDIESMSILKGPNAAALYGSRASNGVVLITTKKGARGKGLGISLSSSTTFENPLVLPKYQNEYGRGTDGNFPQINPSDDLATQVNAVRSTSSWGPKFDGSSQLAYNGEQRPYTAQPDNVKDFFETGVSLINTVALSGSTDKSSVRFSYTNSDLSSILPNSQVKRNNFNLRGFTKLGDKLTLDTKVTYFQQEAQNRPTQGTEGVAAYIFGMARNVRTEDLMTYQDAANPINPNDPYRVIAPTASGGNPYWMLFENSNEDSRRRIQGFAKLTYDINDWLSAFVRAGTDDISQHTENVTANGNHFFSTGRLEFRDVARSERNYDFLIMANKALGERISLSANAGGNARHNTFIQSQINGFDFKIPGRYFLANTDGSQLTAIQSDLIEKKVHSLYGSTSFSLDNMLYLDLTGRNDWSSALSAENRSYFYSSASLSLLLDRLLKLDVQKVNLLKLRASVANVGNDTDAQQTINLFTVASNGYLGNVQINRPNIKFSESLRPEDISTSEVGLEFKLFENRLYGDVSFYNITTKDLIFDVPVDPGTGFSFFRENIGEINNRGFEVLLGGMPVNTPSFRWDASLNFSRNKNTLISLIDGQDNFQLTASNSGIVDVRAQVGEGFGDIYTTTWLRNDAGQLILTAEGRPQATSEREVFGNFQPDLTGGFTNIFSFRNFSLNTLIDFRIGGEVFAFTESALDASGVSERTLEYREGGIVVEGVIEQEDGSFVPNTTSISAQDYWGAVSNIGSEYIFDQTNVRLREVGLSYKIPKSTLNNIGIGGVTVSVIGRNLFFLYKKVDNFDPESSYATGNFGQGVLFYSLPTTKSLGFSVNVNF